MDRIIGELIGKDMYEFRSQIQYPDFQREPTVWSDRKKALLIDSVLLGLDIPKIYLYNPKLRGKEVDDIKKEFLKGSVFDCIDGQQRIMALITFIEGQFKLENGRYWSELNEKEQECIYTYKFTVTVVTHASDEDLRLLFLRLQLGAPLNVGEKLHALTGDMKDFVFKVGKEHPLFRSVSIPYRRFAKETVFAQICINSFSQATTGQFSSARYEELKLFFESYKDLSAFSEQKERIKSVLDQMTNLFEKEVKTFTNRAVIVSGYLFLEELIKNNENEKLNKFVGFYLAFLNKLSEQSTLGLDYDRAYRELLDFQTNILQAAVSKTAIETRHKILKDYFEYYLANNTIKRI
jgi:hypothetical protein